MSTHVARLSAALAVAFAGPALAAPSTGNVQFVNGLAIGGGLSDLSGDSGANARVGFFSDLYYDPARNQWWGVSDRGPGGGTLSYETRVQRFTLNVDPNSGAISNFQVVQTLKFTRGGTALNGLAPNPAGTLGNAFDPEGFVVNPRTGNFIVSDEYGPSVYEISRATGAVVREFQVPANLVPKVGGGVDYNATPPALTAGREPNRGAEGLAIGPDGRYAYAILQNGTIQDGWTASNRGIYTRIVKYDVETGEAVAQYAYRLDSVGQGRGISALVALGDDRFLVIERNNRGIGVGATLASPDKRVYEIDLKNATDVSNVALPATAAAALLPGVVVAEKSATIVNLGANTLSALGGLVPEKWEGLAVGPRLNDGSYLLLAGTDNDYSVTQNGSNVQFDVWYRFTDADPYASSIQCPVGAKLGCTFTTGGAAATLTDAYSLLPGVLHAYKATIAGYVAPVPEPGTLGLLAASMLGGLAFRRRVRADG